jgi:2-keto-3-deoxy-L-rhamnonate aldolase RhmA
MAANPVREKWKAGKPTIGCFLGLGSPHVAGLMAHAGYDWLVIETEHNAMDMAQVEQMLTAIQGTETVPLVRVPPGDKVFIQRALDIGARGVVVPLIKTPEDAAAVIEATRYPPQGVRGFGPLRASHYNFDMAEYFETANEDVIVVFIIETKEAVENLEAIAAIPGVDGFFMGQCDLCLSLGLHPLKYNEYPEVAAIIEKTLHVGQRNRIATGMNAFSPPDLMKLRDEGHTMLAYGPDYVLLSHAARAGIDLFRKSDGETGS